MPALIVGMLMGAAHGAAAAAAGGSPGGGGNGAGWTPAPPGTVIVSDDFSHFRSNHLSFKRGVLKGLVAKHKTELAVMPDKYARLLSQGPGLAVSADLSQFGARLPDMFMTFWGAGPHDFFELEIQADAFAVTHLTGNGKIKVFKDWTKSKAIKTGDGDVNRLGYIERAKSADIVINGAVVFHLPAPDPIAGHQVAFGCVSGKIGPTICGFSRFTITVASGLGPGPAPKPVATSAAVDPAIVGHWRLYLPTATGGLVRLDLNINADGHYSFTSDSPQVMQHSGTLSTTKDHHWAMSSPKYQDGGTYTLPDPNTLDLTGKLGPGVWSRVKG